MKFRTRLTIAFTLLALLIIAVELTVSYLGATRNDQKVALRNLQTTSRLVSQTVDLLVQQANRELGMVARSAFLNEPGRSVPSVNQRLNDFRDGSPFFINLVFCSPAGRVLAASDSMTDGLCPEGPLLGKGMAGEVGIQVLHSDSRLEPARLLFYAPVRRAPSEQPKGVVIAGFAPSSLTRLDEHFRAFRMSGDDRLALELVAQNGQLLFSSDGYGHSPASEPAVTNQLVRETPAALQLITPVPGLDRAAVGQWQLRALLPKNQVYAEARSRLKRKLLLNSLMLAVSVTIISLLAGRLSRPLEELSDAVCRRGEGDDTRLMQLPERHDEFALLQTSLQQMSSHLQENMDRLLVSEERFHALFDAMAEGSALHRIVYDEQGQPCNYLIVEVNRSYQELLGLTREQVLGRLSTEAYQTAWPPYLKEFAEVVATGLSSSFESYFVPLERHFSISVCRVGADSFATIFTDITAKKWHEDTLRTTMAELKAANEAKSRFLAVMSHEIRTPLNGITGMVQLLRDMELPPLQREFLENIDTSAECLLGVINDILDFSKIEAGRLELEAVPFMPARLLQDSLRVMRLRAQAKGLLLSLDAGERLDQVLLGDAHRLTQVLNNLISNAIKFTSGGEIMVRAAVHQADADTQLLQVSVRDSGIGMDEATQQAIFEPFVQADSSVSRKYGGTGLGLAICRQLIELMNGSIRVASSPGQGSTFSFSVPLRPGVLPDEPQTAPPVTLQGQSLRILIAEDQPVNLRFVSEILAKQGHTPLLAHDGQEAVTIWQQEPLDLVLMDIQMPVMDGLKALAAIRAAEDTMRRHTPIIALTAHAIVGDRERLLNAGFDGYLAKPLQVAHLFEEMARVLEMISRERQR